MKNIKLAIGVTLAVIWGAIFLVMPAHAFIDNGAANHNGSAESRSTMDAKGRTVATFGMNFSASANTEADFDHSGMMQDIFGGNADNTPYYYEVK